MDSDVGSISLARLPTDVTLTILEFLTLDAISKLSRTCKSLHELVRTPVPSTISSSHH